MTRRGGNAGRRARLLTADEEAALTERAQQGDAEAKERMIESNLGLVLALARAYNGSRVAFADLVQEGAVGLVRAVDRFDHQRGVKFSTYAVWWIRRAMLDAIAGADVIRLPARANQQLAAVRRVEVEVERIGARRASDDVIAERTHLSLATVRSLRGAARVAASLDEPVGQDTTSLGELVADERAPDPSEGIIRRESRREVSAMLHLLPARHREVIVRRYGLGGRRVHSHDEIGRSLGVGAERSRQIERDALHRLRSIAATTAHAA